MTAAQFRVSPAALTDARVGDLVVVEGPEAHHALRVRRVVPGEVVRLADGAGAGVRGLVEGTDGGALAVRVDAVLRDADPGPTLVLVQALAKGGRDELAIEAATELGVDEVVAWSAERSVVRWRADREAKSLEKWQRVVEAAAKQARRLSDPRVVGPWTTSRLAERMRATVAGGGSAYILDGQAQEPLAGRRPPASGEVLIVVGPEGGVSDLELATFVACGGTPVRLGAPVLRSSTAGPAALAVICAATRWRACPEAEDVVPQSP
ncbi:MAG: 16S rRNA (uracil(1498)-N(3))-methyltransferase [Austwickia sp.]|nr:16S rRNA (uracil(1498)-N(3))-methyltransferase [Austwickia sp.]MBK8435123.1 16S rRNA (uracil(1498)-N(3))-methyltransferase [Austwickia sp.]MBK9101324.1 16S rRNA (uracil(1498)-N(3))-methyltransferase [Austwickia sp.]